MNEEKASQREINDTFFLSPSIQLANHFAGDQAEYVPEPLRRKRAAQFRKPLRDLFHAPLAADLYPDPSQRLDACVQVLRVWIQVVKAREYPAESVNFIQTEPGLNAFAKAQEQVFREEHIRQKWATGKAGTPRRKLRAASSAQTEPEQRATEIPPQVQTFLDQLLGDRSAYQPKPRGMRRAEVFF